MSKPRLMFYTDARHSHIYRFEPPMTRDEYVGVIDELVGTPVEAVLVGLGEGRTMLHDTRAGELLGHNIDKWDHLVFRRAYQNAKALIDQGNDPLRLLCDRAREKGLLIYPLLQVQKEGPSSVPMRCSDFRRNNRHLEIGGAGDLDPETPGFDCLDFKHPEVREERFGIVEEVVNGYTIDGFELNLEEMPWFFHPDEVESGRQILTDWVGRVHEELKKGGKDRELVIEIPLSLEQCHAAGMNVEDWIRREMVEVLIPRDKPLNQMTDFSEVLGVTRGTKTRVHAALANSVKSDRLDFASASAMRAAACNYLAQGVDGLFLTTWHGEWPYEDSFYGKLRELPHPDIMAPRDKLYMLPNTQEGTTTLPLTISEGETVSVSLKAQDDVHHWASSDRVYEILLRLRLLGHTELDRLRFHFNGEELPEESHRRINEIYKQRVPHQRIMGGYWHVFRLGPDHWPKIGDNLVEITMVSRDPDINHTCTLNDVELETRYLRGKNFHRSDGIGIGDVDPDLGPHD